MRLSIHSPDELIAALPYVLGFKPEESLVFVPMRSDLPVARIDLPVTPQDRELTWDSIGAVFSRHARPGASVGIVCVSADSQHADLISQDFATRLDTIGIDTRLRVWADDSNWIDLESGNSGVQSEAVHERIEAVAVLGGRARPAPSREALAASMIGNREPIETLLPEVREAIKLSTSRTEDRWAQSRLQQFHTDGLRLSDDDAARLLVAVDSIPIRDRLWKDMNRANATSHVALWTDLTRRAPDEVRAAPATLLGFAGWLNGDGAMALCALDQVPQDKPYSLAGLLSAAVETGVHPREWESVVAMDQGSGFLAQRPGPQHNNVRPAPGI